MNPATPDISIIICTRNRVAHLAETLRSIEVVDVPPGRSAELVVIDNGSSDGTEALLESQPIRSLPLRVFRESVPGLSRARNAALSVASGAVLLWTDDDVVVPANWLASMCMPILNGNVDAMAGRVLIPDDRLERLRGTVMERRLALLASTEDIDFSAPSRLVGANMAFGRHVLQRVPSFDVKLGAGPDSLGYGEETLFAWQLLAAGYRVGGSVDAPVIHNFELSRVDRASTDVVARRFGASQAYIAYHWHRKRLSGITARIAKARGMHLLKRMFVRGLAGRELAQDELRFNHLSWLSYLQQFRALQGGTSDSSL